MSALLLRVRWMGLLAVTLLVASLAAQAKCLIGRASLPPSWKK
jgi:hypothetical protein